MMLAMKCLRGLAVGTSADAPCTVDWRGESRLGVDECMWKDESLPNNRQLGTGVAGSSNLHPEAESMIDVEGLAKRSTDPILQIEIGACAYSVMPGDEIGCERWCAETDAPATPQVPSTAKSAQNGIRGEQRTRRQG